MPGLRLGDVTGMALWPLLLALGLAAAQNISSSCNIDKYGVGELTVHAFRERYKGRAPVIFATAGANDALRTAMSAANLLAQHGDIPVVLSSANSFSHSKMRSTVGVRARVAFM